MKKLNQFMGITHALISSFCFSLCSVIAKYLIEISAVELTLFRFLGIFLPSFSIAIYKNENFFPEGYRAALFLRCFLGTTGLMLNFYAVQNMNLGDSSVLIYSTPVFVAIFSKLFLNEKCGLFNIANIALTMIGICFIVQPSFLFSTSSSNTNFWGSLAAVASAILGSNVIVILRILKNIDSSVIMSYGFFAIIYTDKILIILLAIFSYLGQYFLTTSLKYEEPNVISLTRSTVILFSFLWQILFFNEVPTLFSLIGSIIIILSVCLSAVQKYALSTNEQFISRTFIRLFQL